ncbi:MAG: 4Fe-4S binding protein [Campylobacterales bacterium]|nr:4Fe-4S binding protein [Campylobacterales bacterium]
MANLSRRGMLASLAFSRKHQAIRPPYGGGEALFHQECPTCIDAPCGTVCEEGIIRINEEKTPELSFDASGCTWCKACAIACPKGVLEVENSPKIHARISIDTATCLAWNSVICSTCKDVCNDKAIDFFGLTRPVVTQACTACGFCVGVCPVDAVIRRSE